MKLILPIVMLLVGAGAGVGAGLFLSPTAKTDIDHADADAADADHDGEDHGDNHSDDHADASTDDHGGEEASTTSGYEYARLNNQFIVPVVNGARVTSLVVLSLSIEVSAGEKDVVFQREPRVRDALLQVMFDHANMGGFDDVFTSTDNMGTLRAALRNAAREVSGESVNDVLVLDVLRQEIPG